MFLSTQNPIHVLGSLTKVPPSLVESSQAPPRHFTLSHIKTAHVILFWLSNPQKTHCYTSCCLVQIGWGSCGFCDDRNEQKKRPEFYKQDPPGIQKLRSGNRKALHGTDIFSRAGSGTPDPELGRTGSLRPFGITCYAVLETQCSSCQFSKKTLFWIDKEPAYATFIQKKHASGR